MSQQYQYPLFGCFGDFRLCLITFCVPAYTIGKNAEHFGEDCVVVGLLACLGLPFNAILRWRLRQEKNLEGSMITDAALTTFCGCCTAIQDAREIGWFTGSLGLKTGGGGGGGGGGDQRQDMERQ